jgi:hypothetical protein
LSHKRRRPVNPFDMDEFFEKAADEFIKATGSSELEKIFHPLPVEEPYFEDSIRLKSSKTKAEHMQIPQISDGPLVDLIEDKETITVIAEIRRLVKTM